MITRAPQSLLAVVAALHLALLPATAGAIGVAPGSATPMQREQAQSKFAKGKELFAQKKYAAALKEFEGSLEIVASPNARLYAARCHRELGNLVHAYVEFGRTEIEAKELAPQDSRYVKTGDSAAAERKDIEPKLGFVTVTVQNAADNTTLKIGGEEVRRAGWNEPAPVMPGTSEVVVETPGRDPVKKSVTVAAGEKTSLSIDAGGTPSSGATTPAGGADKPPPPSEPRDYRTYAYIAGGVGAAGLITFGIFGAMAASRWSTIKDECGSSPCPASKRDFIEGGQTQQRIANVGLVIGILGVATGVTFYVISKPKKPTEPSTSAVIGPSFVGLSGTF